MFTSQGCFSRAGGFLHIFVWISVFPRKHFYSFLPSSGCLLLFAEHFYFFSELSQTTWLLPWEERIKGQESFYTISIVVNSTVQSISIGAETWPSMLLHSYLICFQSEPTCAHSDKAQEHACTNCLGKMNTEAPDTLRHRCLDLPKISLHHPVRSSGISSCSCLREIGGNSQLRIHLPTNFCKIYSLQSWEPISLIL